MLLPAAIDPELAGESHTNGVPGHAVAHRAGLSLLSVRTRLNPAARLHGALGVHTWGRWAGIGEVVSTHGIPQATDNRFARLAGR